LGIPQEFDSAVSQLVTQPAPQAGDDCDAILTKAGQFIPFVPDLPCFLSG
jgi:hypothetical protein